MRENREFSVGAIAKTSISLTRDNGLDGTPIWEKRSIDGPGIWVSCVKGKEKQTVGELYDLFESVRVPDGRSWTVLNLYQLADDLWPQEPPEPGEQGELSLEAQIADEMSSLQKPRKEKRFGDYILFSIQYTHRFVPVSGNCVANLPEIESLCRDVFHNFFQSRLERKYTYKVELRIRNHSTVSRPVLIQHIARCMPEGHTVALENPDLFILVEVFKSVCGVSVVEDYYRLQKFNVMEIANTRQVSGALDNTRV
ncbi:hypothetical protein NP233_g12292 [Leucocoprinus birnbaumii]|uniref:THUMP domain-containing protein n=1 Tax=Leucocoprinus birnbaumii TaxID=56174 RepID=A0AAD5VEV7_9AGAR|nr:hypothetical protein NP233_g12292 [Leucocoprinus birnbaumii]